MKVIHVPKQNKMYETHIGSTSNLKKIQNYVFDLNNVIGTGNFSKVYRGINQLTNHVCAIKVVEMQRMKTPALIKLLQSQCQVLKSLKHPNILNCIQIFTSKNNCYIITDLCNDGDLQSMIQKRGPLDQASAQKIIYETYSGLKYLNQLRIIHRDFKVANVFMNDGVAKIADFGFAKKLKFADEVFNDINIGSPIYMSPQSLLKHRYGPKTDVWAFGVFLYQILHGDTPLYFCKSEADLRNNIGVQTKQSALKPYLSQNLKHLILRCLEVDERKRISMAQMCNHPYIVQLKSKFQIPAHNYNLKVSESTTANSRLQMDPYQGRQKVTSHINIYPQVQTSNNQISFRQTQNCAPQSPMKNTFSHFYKEPTSGSRSPQHILRHKNQQSMNSFSDQRLTVRSNSLDKTPTSITNTLNSRMLTPISRNTLYQTPNSSTQLHPSPSTISHSVQIQPTNVINIPITFAQCVHILHYCRLIYKCVTIAMKQKYNLDSSSLVNWLLSFLKQIQNKQNQVKFDGDRASVRVKKLQDVINEYQSKYQKQLIQFVTINPILNQNIIKQKINDQIITLSKVLQHQVNKNPQMIKLLTYLDFLRESTSLLNICIDKQDFSTVVMLKIQDFLSKKTEVTNVNIQNIKVKAMAG